MFRFRSIFSFLPIASALLAAPATVGAQDINAVIAGLREDIRLLDERTRSLRVEMEQLQRENAALRQQAASSSHVTLAQLNNAIADLEKSIRAGDQQVASRLLEKLEELAKRTNATLDALEKNAAIKPAGPVFNFTDDFPKDKGVMYTVQPGETLLSIAQKHKAQIRDIQNANKIADPKTLQAGQTIFIPQR